MSYADTPRRFLHPQMLELPYLVDGMPLSFFFFFSLFCLSYLSRILLGYHPWFSMFIFAMLDSEILDSYVVVTAITQYVDPTSSIYLIVEWSPYVSVSAVESHLSLQLIRYVTNRPNSVFRILMRFALSSNRRASPHLWGNGPGTSDLRIVSRLI
eukprot:SAG11_NODE_1675_length_4475_cov_20.017824_1_plen_155_part_00